MIAVFIISDLMLMGLTLFFIHRLQLLARKTMYSYRLMSLLGLVIFLLVTFFINILNITFYDLDILNAPLPHPFFGRLLSALSSFDIFALPIIAIFGLALLASNIILLWREGVNLVHVTGSALGIALIALTLVGVNLYPLLGHVMDVHSNLGYHISLFFENIVHIVTTYLECMLISSLICTVRAARYKPPLDADYAIILGCYSGDGVHLPPILRGRVDLAYSFAYAKQRSTGRSLTFIPSGGKGSDEHTSEAAAMAGYLRRKGVAPSRILAETKSTNTYENFQFSKRLLPKHHGKVVFSTTGYHVFRSGVIANSVGLPAEGMGAKTKWYFYLNATIREFVAELVSERRRHLLNILFINLALAIFLIISYQCNLL